MFVCKSAISRNCSSEMRGHANSPAAASSASQTSKSSLTSFWVSFAARDPRLGSNMTSPSAARTLSASRNGVRDIAKEAHSSRSGIRAPGGISPSVKTCLRRETTSSCIMVEILLETQEWNNFECKIDLDQANSNRILLQRTYFAFKNGFHGQTEVHPEGSVNKMNENAPPGTNLLYEVRDGVGRIIFNRPQARNSLTFDMYERLAAICEAAASDRTLKVLILTGAGDKAFASGTDINQFRAFNTPQDAIDY